MTNTKNTWHFSNGNLDYDRENETVVAGLSLAYKPDEIGLCKSGFHSSYRLIDALQYTPGSVLSYCEIGGNIIEDDDKIVSSIRRHLIVVDIERTLHKFAIWCAEQALALIDEPGPRSLEALRVKQLWLDGKATDEELTAARTAAWTAAWTAARTAARTAAGDAARTAAGAAARDAARTAARTAAGAAARTAAGAAARDAQNEKLTNMVLTLPKFTTLIVEEQS